MKISVTISSTYNEELLPSTLRPEELAAVHGGAWNCADADGIVPEYYGVWPDTQAQGLYGIADVVSRNPCQRQIRYDVSENRGLSACILSAARSGPVAASGTARDVSGHTLFRWESRYIVAKCVGYRSELCGPNGVQRDTHPA